MYNFLARRLAFLLTVSVYFILPGALVKADDDYENPRKKDDKFDDQWFHFRTRPDLQAPKFHVKIYDKDAISPGYWFVSPYTDLNRLQRGKVWVGPYIYDGDGNLIWSGVPLFDRFKIWDFRVAEFDGEPMLTGISHRHNGAVIVNKEYEEMSVISWTDGWDTSNMHEFNVLKDGTRALALTRETHKLLDEELSKTVGYEGKCEVTVQGAVELDITVNPPRRLWEWNGLDHIGLNETTMHPKGIEHQCQNNWDLHHFNSLDKFPDGDYLLSSRHTSTIFKISHVDGSVLWRLGGIRSDYTIPEDLQFSRQHFARVVKQNATHSVISLMDNALGWDNVKTYTNSRGLVLALNHEQMTVSRIMQANRPDGKFSDARGTNQLLANGNLFVGWSEFMRMSEHNPDGKVLLDAATYADIGTYRSYKFPWVGKPKQPPAVIAGAYIGGGDRIFTMTYVSWNGATEVKKWRLYESDNQGQNLKKINETNRRGFETDISWQGYAKHVVVEAIDSAGHSIGWSDVVQTREPVPEGTDVDEDFIRYYGESWYTATLTNPISTFVAGFIASAVVWWILWYSRRSRGTAWWRRRGRADRRFGSMELKEQVALVGELDSDEEDGSLKGSSKMYT